MFILSSLKSAIKLTICGLTLSTVVISPALAETKEAVLSSSKIQTQTSTNVKGYIKANPPSAITPILYGQWQGNDGVPYLLEQRGDQVLLYTSCTDEYGQYWSRVFSGTLYDNQIVGTWTDPITSNNRPMLIQVNSSNQLRVASSNNYLPVSFWRR